VHSVNYNTLNYNLSIQSHIGGGCETQGAIACGQTVSGALTNGVQMDTWSYNGAAGESLFFALWCNCGAACDADIYNPSGQWVTNVSTECGGSTIALTLPSSGIYTILVHSVNYSTLNYSLSIQSHIGGGCETQGSIACGQTVAGAITNGVQMDTWSYNGAAGQSLFFALWCNCGAACEADIYNPSGQWVTNVSTECGGSEIALTLPSTGTYTILMHSVRYSTLIYSFSIQSHIVGACNGQPISVACGQTSSRAITNSVDMNAWSYNGTAGQSLLFALWCNCGAACVADIYKPSGQWMTNVSTECGWSETAVTVPSSGTYTILVHSAAYNSTFNYRLGIQFYPAGCNDGTITCGQTMPGSITMATEIVNYNLPVTSGEHVILSESGFSAMILDLYDPSGNRVFSMGNSMSTNYTFANSGNYTVVVHASDYSSTGTYSISLVSFGGCAQLTVDQTVIGTNQDGCLPIEIVASSPAAWVSFTVQTPGGYLTNPSVSPAAPFTNATIVPGTNSEWFVTMSASNGVMGDQIIGVLCFTAQSTQSVFTPVILSNLVITNEGGGIPGSATSNGRVVIIANNSLLQVGMTTNRLRGFTLYGKAYGEYTVDYSTNRTALDWQQVVTNTLPISASNVFVVQGSWSNAPLLLIRAKEVGSTQGN